jgi:hypothetical protein
MEESLSAVVGHQDAAGKATGLLAELAEQSERYAAADESLNQIAHVQGRLGAVAQQSRYVNEVLSQFIAVHEDIIRVAENKTDVSLAIAEVEALHEKLAESAGALKDARQTTNDLYALEQTLISHGYDLEVAKDALNGLIGVQRTLEQVSEEVKSADQEVDGLIALKDKVLAETKDLAAAVETLELSSDLHEQFQEATMSFERIRTWMIEVVGMESLLDRAIRSLRPITELGNLRRLNDEDLRQAARNISDRQRTSLARMPAESSDILQVSPQDFLPTDPLFGVDIE